MSQPHGIRKLASAAWFEFTAKPKPERNKAVMSPLEIVRNRYLAPHITTEQLEFEFGNLAALREAFKDDRESINITLNIKYNVPLHKIRKLASHLGEPH